VFTKYDQFRRNIMIELEDQRRDPSLLDAEVESVFNEHYLANLTGPPPFIRLESEDSIFDDHRDMYYTKFSSARMHDPGQQCNGLIEMTASALSGSVVTLILLAVQRDYNMELSINHAIGRAHAAFMEGGGSTEKVIKLCILAFPSLWVSRNTAFWFASC